MSHQMRAAAIHDLSGFGKCSLTVILPLLSAAGVEACALPTAVLSTHTGGLGGFTFRDLTGDMEAFGRHWRSLGLHFDAIYSGYLGSVEQIQIVAEIINLLKSEDTLVVVDPCMADHGKLYRAITPEMAKQMKQLCALADVIVPNLTEAALLLDRKYHPGPYAKNQIEDTLAALKTLGCERIVLTGVSLEEETLGAACSDQYGFHYCSAPKVPGHFHGTGDIFASVLTGALLRGHTLEESAQIATDFTYDAVLRTSKAGTDPRFGVNFEAGIPSLIHRLGLMPSTEG